MKIQQSLKDGQLINHEKFRSLIPKDVYDLLVEVSREGFSLTLVGGAVRDWLITGNLPHDLDFELRHTFEYEEKDWSFRVNRLGERLREVYRYQVEFLSFSILRISWPNFPTDVELGPSRIENYVGEGPFGHSDFQAALVSSGSYEDTFRRRDFTFNALGIEFRSPKTPDEFAFVDPYGGLKDMEANEIVPCSEQCHKDPVRFCRAIRFKNKLGMDYSETMLEEFKKFDLSKLSLFYFFREAFKCDFFAFSHEFFERVELDRIPLAEEIKQLSFLRNVGEANLSLHNENEVMMYLIYNDNHQLKDDQKSIFASLGNVKEAFLKSHINFKEVLQKFDTQSRQLDELKSLMAKEEFSLLQVEEKLQKVMSFEIWPCLRSFHQMVSRNGKDSFAVMGRMNSHLYTVFLKTYDLIPGTLSGKAIFTQYLDEFKGEPSKRGELEYLAHLEDFSKSGKFA